MHGTADCIVLGRLLRADYPLDSILPCRVKRLSVSPAETLEATGASAAAAEVAKEGGAKTISSTLKTAANVEFGQVETKAVTDAVELRRRLAGQNSSNGV